MKKTAKSLVLCAALLPASVSTAQAQADVFNAIVGIGGALLLNEINRSNQQQPRRTTTTQQSAVQAQAREYRREIQRRLNMLGFDAGTADGIFGPRTRAAISRFQATIGARVTGEISEDQIAQLYTMTTPGAIVGGAPAGQYATAPNQPAAPQFPAVGAGGGGGGQPAAPQFPSMGGEAGSQPAGPQFPAVGGNAGGTSAPQFPAMGGGESGQASAQGFPSVGGEGGAAAGGAPAFPSVGGQGNEQAAAPGFPAVGGEGTSGGQAQTGFPALGGSNGDDAENPTFPTVGSGEQESLEAGPGFPGLGGVSDAEDGQDEFPELAEPAEQAEGADFPALASTDPEAPALGLPEPLSNAGEGGAFPQINPDPDADLVADGETESWIAEAYGQRDSDAFALERILEATPYGSTDDQPRIFGIALGDQVGSAMTALDTRGFEDCADVPEDRTSMQCSQQTDGFTQSVSLAWRENGLLWAIERTVRFDEALAPEIALDSLRTPYPELVENKLVSLDGCPATPGQGVVDGDFDRVPLALFASTERASSALDCPVTYELIIDESRPVSAFTLRFADLSPFVADKISEIASRRQSDEERMTEITQRLEF